MRIYIIDNVRSHAFNIFRLSSNPECYKTAYDRSTTPEFVDLLKNPKKPDKAFPPHPRVLFTNYEVVDKELFGSVAIQNVCRLHPRPFSRHSQLLEQILKMILLGPSSLDSTSTVRSGPKGYAHQWELKSVTPGSIAMAAVVVQIPSPLPISHLIDSAIPT
jgi:hypothetical protein